LIILEDFEEKQQPVDRMIERWLDWWRAPDNRDHALVYEMCMGVVRHRRLLDHAIAPLCTKPLNELTVDLLYALRLGIYQLFFMDRVPDHAAVKETVSALPEGPGRMANAVLREAQRQGEAILKIGDTIATPGGRSETREDVPSTEPEHVKLEKAEADTIADDSPAEAISVDEADTVEISVDEVIEAADDAAAETVDESVETATDDSSESEQSDEETAETLQQVSEDSDAPEPAPVEVSEPLTSLQKAAIEWSFPDWLAEYWAEYLGEEDTIALMKTSHDRPFLILRANAPAISREEVIQRLKTHDEFPLASPVEHSPFGIRLGTVGSNGNASDWKFLKEGTAVVQDEASQLAALLMQPKPGELLLDFCAAPGGKTTLMASQMKNKGLVVAVDRTMPKLRRITQMAQRLGQTNVWTEETPPAEKAWPSSGKLSGPPFDGILVDAPCSGLGTLARRPDVKWLKGKNDMERLAEIQLGILKRVWARLRPGGRLVYSTCTLSPLENEQVVQAFLENQADARLDPLDSERFEFLNNSMITSDGYFRSMPHQHAMDGMFAARLIKVANTLAG
jgi:16S rRNA (cytosine(967)-C(5))-methyltransferase